MSTFGKIFSNVLNKMYNWAENENKLIPQQFGFRKKHSTMGCIFILKTIITHTLQRKEKLFTAFVNFRIAFDLVYAIWYTLLKSVYTQFVKCLIEMYKSVE